MNDHVRRRYGSADLSFNHIGNRVRLRQGQLRFHFEVELDKRRLPRAPGSQFVDATDLCVLKRQLFDAFANRVVQFAIHEMIERVATTLTA